MRYGMSRIYDQEDWDDLEESECDCPMCTKPLKIYYSPTRDDYLLLGFYCRYCDTPYQDMFSRAALH